MGDDCGCGGIGIGRSIFRCEEENEECGVEEFNDWLLKQAQVDNDSRPLPSGVIRKLKENYTGGRDRVKLWGFHIHCIC